MKPLLTIGSFALAGLLTLGAHAWAGRVAHPVEAAAHAAARPAETAAAQAQGAASGDSEQRRQPSCKEILAAPALPEAEGVPPSVSEVVFHHVGDSYILAFESPFSHSAIGVNFKHLLCSLTGWNGVVSVGGKPVSVAGKPIDLTPTKHAAWMWLAAAALVALFLAARPKKGELVPRGMAAMLEMMVLFVRDEIARKTIPGKEAIRYTPYLLTAFFFILTMNLLGLVPYGATATGNLAVTLGLALFTFVLTQVAGIRAAGLGGYLKHLTGGVHPLLWPIMVPVEVLGLFTKPFALTIRLFANMVAGHIVIFFLLGLIFILKSAAVAAISVPFAFAIYLLEIFVALIQAYVFTMLSSLFIGFGVAMGEHGAHEDVSGAHGEAHGEHVLHH
ncbi:MAG: F0F1 ATP synthase subunit A [Myxococcales bacterium]|jgi:F-type H+-transporting ATPase subunit a